MEKEIINLLQKEYNSTLEEAKDAYNKFYYAAKNYSDPSPSLKNQVVLIQHWYQTYNKTWGKKLRDINR